MSGIIQIRGAKGLRNLLNDYPKQISQGLNNARTNFLHNVTFRSRRILRSSSRGGSGRLANSIRFEPRGKWDGVVVVDAPYARAVEEGTLGADITPKQYLKMNLYDGSGNYMGSARKVRGQRPKAYMKRAVKESIPILRKEMKEFLKRSKKITYNKQ